MSVVVMGWLAATALGGDLDPPTGPIAPTMKALDQVEPRVAINATNTPGDSDSLFKITQSGSYYLTGNIQGVVDKHGIEITASGVTLDLSGFDLVGPGAGVNRDGVSVTAAGLTNIAVLNGSVRNWNDQGVDLGGFAATNCRVDGIRAGDNISTGIFIGNASTVSNCSSFSNNGNGFGLGSGCTITNCTANQNTSNGIAAGSGTTVLGCSVSSNTGAGISVTDGVTVSNCSAYQNTGPGINALTAGTISNCSTYQNSGYGISIVTGTVEGCTARLNTLDGIRGTSECMIRNNSSSANGSGNYDVAGIRVTGSDNRIEGNNCTHSGRGMLVETGGNIIVRNTCSNNPINWDIAAGNVCLVVGAAAGGSIQADAGGIPPGSTDPNANFTYY